MRTLLLAFILSTLTGCAMHSDMTNNDFPAISPVPPPQAMIGFWTGSIGYYLVTMKFNPDGSGFICSSGNGRDMLQLLKYDGKQVRISDSTRTDITRLTRQMLVLKVNYFFGATYTMHRDDRLSNAAPYCVQQLTL
ncbi:hypothetical protein NJC38_22155 [Pseudomonas sp. 21LCFQ010]|uniref:J517_1871 family lipoprotein n=1 Tax=Pseudomonas sp. 21LCFQ010 TaxID=2957506 RepID=UPI002096E1AE|nr:J517_1871 family lipoprotein [Pseudomonas sp. 21LCFQ010]MCO8164846.1 hypothetical protein [Pseudomonas sp. 21LCFQ010]